MDTPEVLFCEQLRVLRPRTGAQVQFCAPRLSPRTAVKQVLLSFWQIAARQDCQLWGRY